MKLYMFVETDTTAPREIPVDPPHVTRQVAQWRAKGYRVTVVDEDERIMYGRIAQGIAAGADARTIVAAILDEATVAAYDPSLPCRAHGKFNCPVCGR